MGAGENILEEEENEGCTGLRNMTEDGDLRKGPSRDNY